MPGKGLAKVRDYRKSELTALEEGAKKLGVSPIELLTPLGVQTMDIHLNNVAYWKNIPARVWEYTIGGYQVIKKWLSYRERDLLGRDLSTDEVDEVTAMARRIAAIVFARAVARRELRKHKVRHLRLAFRQLITWMGDGINSVVRTFLADPRGGSRKFHDGEK